MGNRKARQIEAMGGAVTSAFADECRMEKVFGLESFREMAMEYDRLKDEGLSIEGKPTQSHLVDSISLALPLSSNYLH